MDNEINIGLLVVEFSSHSHVTRCSHTLHSTALLLSVSMAMPIPDKKKYEIGPIQCRFRCKNVLLKT